MTMNRKLVLPLLGAAAIALLASKAVLAGSRPQLPVDTPKAYIEECAACHIAYPPGMLPARSWQRIVDGLDRHFGSDASLDAATQQQLASWLQRHAGTYKRVREDPPDDRITRSAWFERKHRKVDPAVWSHASVKSPANCGACHVGAERGVFDDDELRFPAGLGKRYRRAWRD